MLISSILYFFFFISSFLPFHFFIYSFFTFPFLPLTIPFLFLFLFPSFLLHNFLSYLPSLLPSSFASFLSSFCISLSPFPSPFLFFSFSLFLSADTWGNTSSVSRCQLYVPWQPGWWFALLPQSSRPIPHFGPNKTHTHMHVHTHTRIQNLFKSLRHTFLCPTFILLWTQAFTLSLSLTYTYTHTHTHTHTHTQTHTHLSPLPTPLTGRQTPDLRGYNSVKKKEEKHRNQPRPEIDEWRWQRFWQAEWSRSLNGSIQEEIRNTHRVWSVHYLSRDDPKINNNNGKISQ